MAIFLAIKVVCLLADKIMIDEQEAQKLMFKLSSLKEEFKKNPNLEKQLKNHENLCIEKFKYLILMKTYKYKSFNNYEDLKQEGYEALLKAMINYDPKKGSVFWWFHKYIDTRISRCANLHTTIRYPLKYSVKVTPHKENFIPIISDTKYCPHKKLESVEMFTMINKGYSILNNEQKQVIDLVFGIDCDKPKSIKKVCDILGISRSSCIKIIKSSFKLLKDNLKL